MLTVLSPLDRQIVQRNVFNYAYVPVYGTVGGGVVTAQVRFNPIPTYPGVDTGFLSVPVSGTSLTGNVPVQAGWYTLEIKTFNSGSSLVDDITINHVGVGDVFVTCGQSNAANYYAPLNTTAPDDRVNCRGITSANPWRLAIDPQPSADGALSSVWPKLGDLVVANTTYPVGFVSVAMGNTTVAQWAPGTSNSLNLRAALKMFPADGIKSILWHQGENDASFGTSQASYVSGLTAVIEQSRIDAGWNIPWGIATTVTHPNEATGAGVMAGQTYMAENYLGCYLGANTDTLDNSYRQADHVHFNSSNGRDAHAALWAPVLNNNFVSAYSPMVIDSVNNKILFWNNGWHSIG